MSSQVCVKDSNNIEADSDVSLEIPSGTVIAYSILELEIKKNGHYGERVCVVTERHASLPPYPCVLLHVFIYDVMYIFRYMPATGHNRRHWGRLKWNVLAVPWFLEYSGWQVPRGDGTFEHSAKWFVSIYSCNCPVTHYWEVNRSTNHLRNFSFIFMRK